MLVSLSLADCQVMGLLAAGGSGFWGIRWESLCDSGHKIVILLGFINVLLYIIYNKLTSIDKLYVLKIFPIVYFSLDF